MSVFEKILEESLKEILPENLQGNENNEKMEETLKEIQKENFLENLPIPDGFYTIMNSFIDDIKLTFPEYTYIIQKWWGSDEKQIRFVFEHCMKIFPLKTFEIINENDEIFAKTNNTEFLPNILFCYLWESEISDNTRKIIWKYFNTILASLLSSIKINSNDFVNEPEMIAKLSETLKNVHSMFDEKKPDSQDTDFQEKFKEMTGGKIGKLAVELAEETAKSLNMEDSPDGVMELLKNPTKLLNMVKNMGDKLDERLKTGEINENEIMNEGIDLMKKMKDMPGMGDMCNIFKMFENMGDMSPAQKGACNTQLKKNVKLEATKERMRKKQKAKVKDPEVAQIEHLKEVFKSL
jgi:hypothetical protein